MRQKERHIEVFAILSERLFIRFKRECYRQQKSEERLIVEMLEKTLPNKAV